MGLELGYDESGSARIAMPRDARFDHGMGDTHGGVFATLLDSAGWFTVAAVTGRSALTTNLNVYMLQPAKRGGVIASGAVQWAGRRAAVPKCSFARRAANCSRPAPRRSRSATNSPLRVEAMARPASVCTGGDDDPLAHSVADGEGRPRRDPPDRRRVPDESLSGSRIEPGHFQRREPEADALERKSAL